jgi:hypothetical protein
MRPPVDRLDSYLIATGATATGADRLIRVAGEAADPASLTAAARRFVEVPLFRFAFGPEVVYVTAADAIAIGTAVILAVRFAAWVVSPLIALARRYKGGSDDPAA